MCELSTITQSDVESRIDAGTIVVDVYIVYEPVSAWAVGDGALANVLDVSLVPISASLHRQAGRYNSSTCVPC